MSTEITVLDDMDQALLRCDPDGFGEDGNYVVGIDYADVPEIIEPNHA